MERKVILSELIRNDEFVSNEELDLVKGGNRPVKTTPKRDVSWIPVN